MIDLRQGDCLELMKDIPDNSIDLTVTSPPYDDLRTYNGYSFDFENIAKELYRITKKGGVVVWVVGDQTIKGSESGTSFKQALYFKEIGFNLHDTMIWKKSNPFNFGSNNCYIQSFEYVFIFSKGKPKSLNFIYDRENKTIKEGQLVKMQRRTRNGDYMETEENKYSTLSKMGKRHNVWEIPTSSGKGLHPAVFPEQLAHDHIVSWSNEGDTVLDCFMGSGTTGKMAKLLNRNFIGIEISEDYMKIAKERIENAKTQESLILNEGDSNMDEEKNEIDRIREAYEYRLKIAEQNLDTKMLELDQYKTRYSGMFSRQTILDTLEATRDKLRRYLELTPIEQLKQEHTEEYYKGAIQAFILVLSHKEDKEVLLQKR